MYDPILSNFMTEERERISAREAGTIDAMVGRVLDGRYRLLRKLGQGGMGSVYLADDQRLKIKIAVKLIVPKSGDTNQVGLQRFRFEAHAAARIQSDHVVRVSDFGVSDEATSPVAYIAMEYLKGEDLSTYLERWVTMHGPLPWPRAKKLIIDIAQGLASVHEAGLVHRDMKPSNCFLAKGSQGREQVKIFDFGIAKSMETNSDQLTREGMIIGTMAYMAPEQAMGNKVDGRTDIYALGAILFQMLSGRPPFIAGHWHELLAQIANTPPPYLSAIVNTRSLPPQIDSILQQTLQKDPNRRFPTIAAFVSAIEALKPELDLEPTQSQVQTSQHPAIRSAEKTPSEEATTIVVSPEGPETEKSPPNHAAATARRPHKRWLWASTFVVVAIISGFLWQLDVLGWGSTPNADHEAQDRPQVATNPESPPVKIASIIPDSARTSKLRPSSLSAPSEESNHRGLYETKKQPAGNPSPSILSTPSEESNHRGRQQTNKQLAGNPSPSILEDTSVEQPTPKRSAKKPGPTTNKRPSATRKTARKDITPPPPPKKPTTSKPSYATTKEVQQQLSSLLKKAIADCKKLHLSAAKSQAQVMIEIGLNGKIQRFDPLIRQKTSSTHKAAVCVGRILRGSLNITPRLSKTLRISRIIEF